MARKLLKWVKVTTVPTLSTVAFSSNNAVTTKAKVGDIVTLTWTSSIAIQNVIATIAGKNVAVNQLSPTTFSATYTTVTADSNGTIPFTINFKSLNGVAGVAVTGTTGGEIVTFDKTAPTLASATRTSDTVLNVVVSELCGTASITKANAGGFLVKQTGSPGTAYAVSAIAPGVDNTHVVLTVASMTASSAAGVTVTYASGGNGTVADVAGNALATDTTGVVVAAW